MASPHVLFLVGFQRTVRGAGYEKSAEERCVKRNITVMLLLKVGTASLCGPTQDSSSTLLRHVHNWPLYQHDGLHLIAIRITVNMERMETQCTNTLSAPSMRCTVPVQISTQLV